MLTGRVSTKVPWGSVTRNDGFENVTSVFGMLKSHT